MTADLNYAINNLPETAPRGRMTKGIAMTILLKYRMIQGKFVEAEQLCRDIIALGVYGLQADYTAIFDINNHGNNEIILCVPCNSSSSWTANYMIAEVLPADMPWADNAAGWGGYVMPWDFYNTFNYADKRLACIHTEYVSTTGKYMDKSNSVTMQHDHHTAYRKSGRLMPQAVVVATNSFRRRRLSATKVLFFLILQNIFAQTPRIAIYR